MATTQLSECRACLAMASSLTTSNLPAIPPIPIAVSPGPAKATPPVQDFFDGTRLRVPDAIEPLVGYRGWDIEERDGELYLRATNFAVTWMPGENGSKAVCKGDKPSVEVVHRGVPQHQRGEFERRMKEFIDAWWVEVEAEHEVPYEHCRCGFYALRDLSYIESYYGQVYGEVALWGKVIKGTRGYRASNAKVTALYTERPGALRDPFPPQKLQQLADRYQVPIIQAPPQLLVPDEDDPY